MNSLIERVREIADSQQHIDTDFARATNATGDLRQAATALAKLQAENTELIAQRDHNWQEYLDERSARMAENNRNHRLTEALRPFAALSDKWPECPDGAFMTVHRFNVYPHQRQARTRLKMSDFRAASRALDGREG